MVSLDPDVGELDEADVLIDDGEIVEIGRGLTASNADVIDAENHIVLPGFVDSHIHLAQTQVRGIAGDWSLMGEYFEHMLGNITGLYQPEDMYLGGLFGALRQETTDGVHASRSVVTDSEDRPIGALSVSGPANRMEEDRLSNELPDLVMGAANELELHIEHGV